MAGVGSAMPVAVAGGATAGAAFVSAFMEQVARVG
jgi:hypothetical protein